MPKSISKKIQFSCYKLDKLKPSRDSSVGRASGLPGLTLWAAAWQLLVSSPTNASQVCGRDGSAAMLAAKRLAGVAPEVNLRECICLHQARIRLPTLALKPRGNVTRSPKQGYQWPHKKESCPPKIFFKKNLQLKFYGSTFVNNTTRAGTATNLKGLQEKVASSAEGVIKIILSRSV